MAMGLCPATARSDAAPDRIGAVVILHVLVVWALVSGLARKVVEVVKVRSK